MSEPSSRQAAETDGEHAGWFDRPMRWGQLTLVEDDPERYDPAFWLDYFQRTKCDAVCLSAGGYMAFYPTEIPLHYRSAWLGDRDPFGELVTGCQELGMVVVARTDPHAVHQDVYDAHPDWIAVGADGKPRRHWSMPELWVTCALGPYNVEFMTDVHRELMNRYPLAGIFSNRWAGSGVCYCEHCERNFADATGMALPRTDDARDPVRRAYLEWRQQRLFEICELWDTEIRKINPTARYIPNSGGGALSDLDMSKLGELTDILFADRQGRSGTVAPWAGGKNAKEYRATMGSKPIGGIFSVGLEARHRWKDSTQSAAEIRVWAADIIANGMRPWFTKFAGVVHDGRWLDVVEDIYVRHQQWEPYLRNTEPLARVGIVYSQQSAAYYGGPDARELVEDHCLGFYQALLESRVPFEMVHDRLLRPELIDRFACLVLPNIAALSDEQCAQLRDYVERGGSLVATYETSRYDEWGSPRDDFGLADLFGVRFTGMENEIKNSYVRVDGEADEEVRAQLLDGLDGASRIIGGTKRAVVEATVDFPDHPLTVVPAYADLPMEEVYPRVPRTDEPAVYLRTVGSGRVAYIPWDLDRTFWEVLDPDHGKVLANTVRWASGEDPRVVVEGPGMLDVTVWRQAESMTVHLVNFTNPMAMRGAFRELIPCGPQRVRVRLPDGYQASQLRLLRAGYSPAFEADSETVELTVDPFDDHEIIAIDLRPA